MIMSHSMPFPNNGFPKPVSSAHSTTPPPPKSYFTLPYWTKLSLSNNRLSHGQRIRKWQVLDAFIYLESMVLNGYAPDPAQATELMWELCRLNQLEKASRVMNMTFKATGRPPGNRALVFLLSQQCHKGRVWHAMQLIDKMETVYGVKTDISSYNNLLSAFAIERNLPQIVKLVERMLRRGLEPDVFSFSCIVEAAYVVCGGDAAERLLEAIAAEGWRPGLRCYNTLLTRFCNEGRFDDAIRLFRSLPSKRLQPGVVSYNILLRGFCDNGRWADAANLLDEMSGMWRLVNSTTYDIVAAARAVHGHTSDALKLVDDMTRKGFRTSAFVFIRLLEHFCKKGDVAAAKDCLDSMINKHNLVPDGGVFNAVALLCRNPPGLVHEAFDILQTICAHDQFISKTIDFYRSVVIRMCGAGNTSAAIHLLPEMARVGFMPDPVMYSGIIRGFCMEGMLDEAQEVIGIMEEEGAVTFLGKSYLPVTHEYNALARAFIEGRRMDKAVSLYARMVEKGLMPNEDTYSILVRGIAQEYELELAAEVLMELHCRDVVTPSTVQRIAMEHRLEELVGMNLERVRTSIS